MFRNNNWEIYSASGKALIVQKMSNLFSALTTGGVDNPIQDYYEPVQLLIQNVRALDFLIAYNTFLQRQTPLLLPFAQGNVEYLNEQGDSYVDTINKLSTT